MPSTALSNTFSANTRIRSAAVNQNFTDNRTHIGFRAYLSGNTGYNDGNTVVFDTENFDTGSDYAIATGIFTAPVDGYYIFYSYLVISPTVDQTRYGLDIYVSTIQVIADRKSASGTSSMSVGATTGELYMSESDTAYVKFSEQAAGAPTVVGGQFTFFGGKLVGF